MKKVLKLIKIIIDKFYIIEVVYCHIDPLKGFRWSTKHNKLKCIPIGTCWLNHQESTKYHYFKRKRNNNNPEWNLAEDELFDENNRVVNRITNKSYNTRMKNCFKLEERLYLYSILKHWKKINISTKKTAQLFIIIKYILFIVDLFETHQKKEYFVF